MRMHECNDGMSRGFGPGMKMAFRMMAGRHASRHGGFEGGHEWAGHRGGPGSGARRGGGPRGRMFAGGELRLVLLRLIADQSRHGYELIKAIEELTGGRYAPSPGVVYPTLSLLLDEGAITEVADDSPRKAFAASDQGQAELAERKEEAQALLARLTALNAQDEAQRSPPIARAVSNLFTALRGRDSQRRNRQGNDPRDRRTARRSRTQDRAAVKPDFSSATSGARRRFARPRPWWYHGPRVCLGGYRP